MFRIWVIVGFLAVCFKLAGADSLAHYKRERQEFLDNENMFRYGSQVELKSKERAANKVLMKYKNREMQEGFENPGRFPPTVHFFEGKWLIHASKVFKIIKNMPKGGVLHLRDTSGVSLLYVLRKVLQKKKLYMCIKDGNKITFAFYAKRPKKSCFKSMRKHENKISRFEDFLTDKITLLVPNNSTVQIEYPDINKVRDKFESLFKTLAPVLNYRPVYEEYFYQCLTEFYEDNVHYMEMRGPLPTLYELNGTKYGPQKNIEIMIEQVEKFKKNYPDFIDFKFIYAPSRNTSDFTFKSYLRTYQAIKTEFPDFVIGFDLFGQEDLGRPLVDFVNVIRKEADEDYKFFFHAGETNWYGMPADLNLVDAILLNTTRIGNGYALPKHPLIMQQVYDRNIGIEVNPISNQMLKLVRDLRNHPAAVLFAQGYPVVISCDSPGFWDAKGLSYDFYMAFMAIASADSDLRTLKTMALNSFEYSGLELSEKELAIEKWEKSWKIFVDNLASGKIV